MVFKSSLLKNKIIKKYSYLDNVHFIIYFIIIYYLSIAIMEVNTLTSPFKTILILVIPLVLILLWNSMGKMKFDPSLYELPIEGEELIVTKSIKYNINKVRNSRNYIHDYDYIFIEKGQILKVMYVGDYRENNKDFIIKLTSDNSEFLIDFFYLDINDKFMTKQDFRNLKLTKILEK